MTGRGLLFGLLAGLAGCGADACGGDSGTCLSIALRGEVLLDTLRLEVSGAVANERVVPLPMNVSQPPFQIALLLPSGGSLQVDAVAERGGQVTGLGRVSVELSTGARRQAVLQLSPVGGAACDDGYRDGKEGDVDCGGDCMARCPAGRRCAEATDCTSLVCPLPGRRCVAPSCADRIVNGDESDLDCGGSCPLCGDGARCRKAEDCKGRICTPGRLCASPRCDDQVKNSDESDVDCGGACPPCLDSKACTKPTECVSRVCASGSCAVARCDDLVKNADEADVDCGGACPPCGDGKSCGKAEECASRVCTGGLCVAARCDDRVKNGAESDLDCGGGMCPGCAPGRSCGKAADCASTVCKGGLCVAATCADGTRNDVETDVDCGGGVCAACKPGRGCAKADDCFGKSCLGGLCTLVFAKARTFTAGAGPQQIVTADFNYDKKLDLAVAANGDAAVAVLLNDGAGGFGASTLYAVGKQPIYLAAITLENDVRALLVPSYFDSHVKLLAYDPNRPGFIPVGTLPTAAKPIGIAVADFNKDLQNDFVTSSESGQFNLFTVLKGNQFAIFESLDPSLPALWSVAAGDWNGDGTPDIGLLAKTKNQLTVYPFTAMGLAAKPTQTVIAGRAGIAAGDLDRDGRADAVVAETVDLGGNAGARVAVLLGKADATFQAPLYAAVGSAPIMPALGDFDGDGRLDLACPNSQSQTVSVLRGRGDGTFDPKLDLAVGNAPTSVVVGDFDGDGKLDLAVANFASNDVTVIANALK